MHADPVGTTTASMIARLEDGEAPLLTYWASLASPCLGLFLPLYVQAEVPAELAIGGEHSTEDSPWWGFKALLTRVEGDWALAPRVRAYWDEIEAAIEKEREQVEAHVRDLRRRGETPNASAELSAFSRRAVDGALAKLAALRRDLA
jgi:dipeptidase